jgi:hypothetical protein
MMTLEKPTMADMSGEKRDRRSDHTDNPHSSPNIKDTKLLCADDQVAIGKQKNEEIVENKENGTSDEFKADNGGELTRYDSPLPKNVNSKVNSHKLDEMVKANTDHTPTELLESFDATTDDFRDTGAEDLETDLASNSGNKAPPKTPSPAGLKKDQKVTHSKNKENNEKEQKKNNNNKKEINNNDMDTSDTNGIDEFDDKAVLILAKLKGQTSKWKGLTQHLQNLPPYTADNKTGAIMDLYNFTKYFNITDKTIGRDHWVELFSKAHSFAGKKTKLLNKFGVTLAASNPHELFLPQEFNGERLLTGRLQNAWAGAYVFYCPG